MFGFHHKNDLLVICFMTNSDDPQIIISSGYEYVLDKVEIRRGENNHKKGFIITSQVWLVKVILKKPIGSYSADK